MVAASPIPHTPTPPDIAAAQEFLRRLDPGARSWCFQTFDDSPNKWGSVARVMHGDAADLAPKFRKLQGEGAGVFVTIAETDGRGRQAHNIARVRAVFVDLDAAPLGPVLAAGLAPHIVVESSANKWHAYWRVADCDRTEFGPVQRALARRFEGDPSVHDLPRVMRLPGFLHQKHAPAFRTRIVHESCSDAPPYRLAELVTRLGLELDEVTESVTCVTGGRKSTDRVPAGERNSRLFSFGRRMAKKGATREAVAAALAAENAAKCDPPLPENEVRILVDRAFTAKDSAAWKPEPPPVGDATRTRLIYNNKGELRACEHNARVLLGDAAEFEELHFDEYLCRLRIAERDWTDADDRTALLWLQSRYRVASFTLSQTRNAVLALAHERRIDSLRVYIENLPTWDEVPRIDNAFRDAWGAADDEMTRSASHNFFVALIARGLRPGAQVDTLWTFEGPQGSYKSQALRALGGPFHAEITAQIGTADFLRELRGIWIAELSELDSLRGKEASTVKRLLSAPTDRFVEKFEKHATAYPRRAIAVATTNEAQYWQDSTGARRLIPIRTGTIDVPAILREREQWFAEARAGYEAGHTWWEFPPATTAAQEDRQQVDPWEDTLAHMIAEGRPERRIDDKGQSMIELVPWPEGWISSAEIMRTWLRLEPHQQGPASSTRLGRVMRRLGFKPQRQGNPQERGWGADTPDDGQSQVSAEVSTYEADT